MRRPFHTGQGARAGISRAGSHDEPALSRLKKVRMFLSNMSIGRRLAVVLGMIVALSVASSVFAVFKLGRLGDGVAAMVGENLAVERATTDWLRISTSATERARAIAKSSDTGLVAYFAPASVEGVKKTTALTKVIEARMDQPEERRLFDATVAARKAFLEAKDEVGRLKLAGDGDGAQKVFSERFEPVARDYIASVEALATNQREQLDARARAAAEERERTTWLLLASAGVSLVGSVLLAIYLARSITAPLKNAEKMAEAIARMDLSDRAQSRYANDETGRLLRAIDRMRAALTTSMRQIRGVADGIATASSQIATGNQELSSRTEQTASNLQETASSMEQLTGAVRQSADSAAQANQMATAAAQVAERGGRDVEAVVATMAEINASSHRIADIIGVIDGIAFQTNILALNAAVEAARAGEQGRGFAVVASEVRSLAQRSATAAKEIKELIGQSVDKVNAGARLVRDAGATMGEIVTSVQRVSDIIGEVTASSAEQSGGIGQIGQAVAQLDGMTQQNAALVEESAAAAASLRDQAQVLGSAVGAFRLAA
jgi:methyl-accepting chemotaxis protein